jgi:hypothetical protein
MWSPLSDEICFKREAFIFAVVSSDREAVKIYIALRQSYRRPQLNIGMILSIRIGEVNLKRYLRIGTHMTTI